MVGVPSTAGTASAEAGGGAPGGVVDGAGEVVAQAVKPAARTVSSHELCREPDPINLHPVRKIDAMAEMTLFSL
jgi:hypothetical protein